MSDKVKTISMPATNGHIPAIKPAKSNLLTVQTNGENITPRGTKKGLVAFADPPAKTDQIPNKEPKMGSKPTYVQPVTRNSRPAVTKKTTLQKLLWPFTALLEILGILEVSPGQGSSEALIKNGDEPKLTVGDPMLIFGCIRFKAEWVIRTEDAGYYCWLTLVTIVVLYNIIVVALRATFNELDEPDVTFCFMITDYIGDAILVLDIFVNICSSHLSEDLLIVEEPRKLFAYWSNHTKGQLDILSVLPTDVTFIWTGMESPYVAVRFNRLLKLYKLNEWLARTEGFVADPQIWRLTSVLLRFFLLIHLNACLYYFISDQVGLNSDGWVYPAEAAWRKEGPGETNADDSLFKKYIWSFYWAFNTLTMIGITKQPETPWQFLFLTVQFVSGVMLYSQILANTIQTVLKATAAARKFRTKIDLAVQYLDMRGVTGELRQRVMDYFEYQWMQRRLVDDKDALLSLPEKLEADLAIEVHLATLKHVRIFQGVEPGLLIDLVLKLQLQVYAPGEYVCRKGDIGRELYIIKTGTLEVVSDDGGFVYARLGAGSVFGEISILNIKGIKSGNRRTANVRSIGYADLFCLSKDALWQALEEYPEGKNKILDLGREILLKDNLLNVQQEKEHYDTQRKFLDKLIKVEDGVNAIQTKFGRLVAERAAVFYKMNQRIVRLQRLIDVEKGIVAKPNKAPPVVAAQATVVDAKTAKGKHGAAAAKKKAAGKATRKA